MRTLILGVLAASSASGEPEHEGIGFEAALEAAESHPSVRAEMARLEARDTLDDGLGGLATDPMVQLQPGFRAAAPRGGFDGFDGSVGLQQSFNLHGWGGARRSAAQAERSALAVRIEAVRRAARRQAAQAWLETWARTRELALREQLVAEAKELLRQAERRFELGMGRRLEREQARAFSARAELDRLQAEGRLFEAELDLAAACSRATPLFATGPLPEADLPEDLHRALGVESDPHVRAARAERVAAEKREAEAAAQDGWQLLTGVNVATEPPGDVIPSALLGVTLPVSGRNRRSTASRAADRAAAARTEDATHLAARRLRARGVHEVEHTRAVEQLHRDRLVPARRAEVAALEREFELGGLPLRRLLDARIRLLEAEIGAAVAIGRAHAAAYDLELILGNDDEART